MRISDLEFRRVLFRSTPGADLTVMGALREVFGTRSFLYLAIGGSFVAFLTYGKNLWALILFQRSHGLSAGETGLLLGVTIGAAGIVGTWLGGYLADLFGSVDRPHLLTPSALGLRLGAQILFPANWFA